MNIKELVVKQYRDIIDIAAQKTLHLTTPPEGWLRTNRKALKMPAKIILERAGIKKVSYTVLKKQSLKEH